MTLRRVLIGATLIAVNLGALAASVDCAKAGTAVEHMICADPAVSSLDQRLTDEYKAASGRDPHVKEAQREWLLGTRNKCSTTDCLSEAYAARLAALKRDAPVCAITASAPPYITGTWTLKDCRVHIAGTGDHTDSNFVVTGFSRGRLSLKDESDSSALVPKKAK